MQQPSHKPTKPPKKKPSAKPKSSNVQVSAPTSAGKRWTVGASWDGFGVKAGLDINSRNVANPNAYSKISGPVYRHSEVVATLTAPGPTDKYIMETHVFQPGSSENFPWLHNMASGFQQYRVKKAVYRYEPFTSVFGDTGKQGRVSLFFDYNVSAPVDSNIDDMLNKAPSVNTQSSKSIALILNPRYMVDNARKTKNLRTDDQTSTNLDSFDAGHLIVGLDEFTFAAEFGKIWVDYEVEFLIPSSQKVQGFAPSATIDAFYTSIMYAGASGTNFPLSMGWTAAPHNAGNVHLVGTGSLSFDMEQGTFLVILRIKSARLPGNSLYGLQSFFTLAGLGNVSDSADILAAPAVRTIADADNNMFVTVPAGSLQNLIPVLAVWYSALTNAVFECHMVFVYSA